jgi:hypothetical protein
VAGGSGTIGLELQTTGDDCSAATATRMILIAFDHPVDLTAFRVEYSPSGG